MRREAQEFRERSVRGERGEERGVRERRECLRESEEKRRRGSSQRGE